MTDATNTALTAFAQWIVVWFQRLGRLRA